MKQFITASLRKSGHIAVSDRLRFSVVSLKNYRKNKSYQSRNPNEALPPPYMIYETFRLDYERYLQKGKIAAEWVCNEVSHFLQLKNINVLDWVAGREELSGICLP